MSSLGFARDDGELFHVPVVPVADAGGVGEAGVGHVEGVGVLFAAFPVGAEVAGGEDVGDPAAVAHTDVAGHDDFGLTELWNGVEVLADVGGVACEGPAVAVGVFVDDVAAADVGDGP